MIQSGTTCAVTAVPSGAGGEQGAAAVTAAAVLKSIFTPEDKAFFRVATTRRAARSAEYGVAVQKA